jgi:hypothetical protein
MTSQVHSNSGVSATKRLRNVDKISRRLSVISEKFDKNGCQFNSGSRQEVSVDDQNLSKPEDQDKHQTVKLSNDGSDSESQYNQVCDDGQIENESTSKAVDSLDDLSSPTGKDQEHSSTKNDETMTGDIAGSSTPESAMVSLAGSENQTRSIGNNVAHLPFSGAPSCSKCGFEAEGLVHLAKHFLTHLW